MSNNATHTEKVNALVDAKILNQFNVGEYTSLTVDSNYLKAPIHKDPVNVDENTGLRSQKIIGEKTTVVINPDTKKIITTYPTKSAKLEKYKKGGGE